MGNWMVRIEDSYSANNYLSLISDIVINFDLAPTVAQAFSLPTGSPIGS